MLLWQIMDAKEKMERCNKGQAIFELLVFLPLLIFIFTIMITIGDSINGSINQQKAVRRYFFHLYKGNSMLPTKEELDNYRTKSGLGLVGVSSVAWSERTEGDNYWAGCYPFNSAFMRGSGDLSDESCDDPVDGDKSRFIRVYTAFGLCGETYVDGGNGFEVGHTLRSIVGSCTLSEFE